VTVLAAADLHAYLSERGAWEALANPYGIALRRDPALAPGSHRIEELS
jgi:hypothetical protein